MLELLDGGLNETRISNRGIFSLLSLKILILSDRYQNIVQMKRTHKERKLEIPMCTKDMSICLLHNLVPGLVLWFALVVHNNQDKSPM